MAGYQKNTWEVFDENIPAHEQPNAFITKDKLERMENGIYGAVTDLKIGTVIKGTDISCEIVPDEYDPSIKRLNMVIPKEVSWLFSELELYDQDIAPTGVFLNDMILDIKGNIFTITQNINGLNILNKRTNIKGERGNDGTVGPEGKPGVDGIDGKNGKDGNKWVFIDQILVDGDEAPLKANIDDFIFDISSSVFTVTSSRRLKKIFNLHGIDGNSAYDIWINAGNTGTEEDFIASLKGDEYYLEIGEVVIGKEASAEIVDHKLNLIVPVGPTGEQGPQGIPGPEGPPGKTGPAGESTYDIWKALGNTGNAADFLESIRGETGPSVIVIDSLDSTSTTEALSANQGRILKNNRLTTLDEILANEEEGIFVDALAVKELYLKMQELIKSLQ